MAKVQKGKEIIAESFNPLSWRTNVTDDRQICDSRDSNVK